jgi:hypothetical protein
MLSTNQANHLEHAGYTILSRDQYSHVLGPGHTKLDRMRLISAEKELVSKVYYWNEFLLIKFVKIFVRKIFL